MPALLIRMSRASTCPAAAWICAALVTSRAIGVTRASGWARDRRVPAYTRFAPLLRASATSACPMPRVAPVTRTVLPAIVIALLPYGVGSAPPGWRPLIQTRRIPQNRRGPGCVLPRFLAARAVPGSGAVRLRRGRRRGGQRGCGAVLHRQAEQREQARVREGDDPRDPRRGNREHLERVREIRPAASAPVYRERRLPVRHDRNQLQPSGL